MQKKNMRNFLKQLRKNSSGNATLLVALGMPVLIGGAGLGVDMAQWYMWKRELQYAVDQAAVAGAWEMAKSSTSTSYQTRATQEFSANVDMVSDFATTPNVTLANFAGGTLNSVVVTASASKSLPFSHFLTGSSANVEAYAQATFERGTTFTSCLIATDVDDEGAVLIGGNAILTASCGIAALSTDELSIRVNGNPTIDAGWIISAGGIDDWLKENTDDVILEYQDGLIDPFETLSPPYPAESQVSRTYSCAAQAATTSADVETRTQVTYTYWQGRNTGSVTAYDYPTPRTNTDDTDTQYGILVTNNTTAGTVTPLPSTTWTQIGGSGNSKKYERRVTQQTITTSNVAVSPGTNAGDIRPGTYEEIQIGCNTTFAPGVYHIMGGGLIVNGQNEVNGSGVMFVLHDGAYLKINGGADINLTAIQASDLIARGIAAEQANKLAGMLVFEERTSEGSNKTNINGNSNTILNGTIYFPVSEVFFAGTAGVTSQCLMIAARNIIITGTTNMSTFCPTGSSEDTVVATTSSKVRLVA